MSVRWSDWAPNRASRDITIGVAFGIALSISFTSISTYIERRRRIEREKAEGARDYVPRPIELRSDEIVDGVVGLIGNTPLVRINSLSEALGVDILGKAEFLNPGGSVKDRVALKKDMKQVCKVPYSIPISHPNAQYNSAIIMPDDVAAEKERALLALGATVEKNLAKHRALEFGKTEMHTTDDSMVASTQGGPDKPRGFFADQFESPSNYQAHLQSTGPELWRQCSGRLDAFVSGAGTGGTIAGVGRYLKSQDKDVRVVLSDPEGSGLYNKIKNGVMFDVKEAEGTKRRHQVDTVVEGMQVVLGLGINRLTRNFEMASGMIDDAIRVTDKEAVAMSRYLVQNDGLFLGSSSACNLVACIKVAKELGRGKGKVVATILCDSGTRHYSKFWNDEYLEKAGIEVDVGIVEKMLKD
ncbi:PALP protein, partial [Rhizoctonia solani]